jgi:hypothetical protein
MDRLVVGKMNHERGLGFAIVRRRHRRAILSGLGRQIISGGGAFFVALAI